MNEPQKTAGKTKSNGIGTLLTIGATALATYLAMKNKDKLTGVANTIATNLAAGMQKLNDGGLEALAPGKQNGSSHTAAAPAGH